MSLLQRTSETRITEATSVKRHEGVRARRSNTRQTVQSLNTFYCRHQMARRNVTCFISCSAGGNAMEQVGTRAGARPVGAAVQWFELQQGSIPQSATWLRVTIFSKVLRHNLQSEIASQFAVRYRVTICIKVPRHNLQ